MGVGRKLCIPLVSEWCFSSPPPQACLTSILSPCLSYKNGLLLFTHKVSLDETFLIYHCSFILWQNLIQGIPVKNLKIPCISVNSQRFSRAKNLGHRTRPSLVPQFYYDPGQNFYFPYTFL